MSKLTAGENEVVEFRFLSTALAMHEKLAKMYEEHGMRKLADEEWAKFSMLLRAIKDWEETWEFPAKGVVEIVAARIARFKEKKENVVKHMAQALHEHAGMSRKTSLELAKALFGNRDISSLALQYGWDFDGTDLKIGCLKMKKLGVYPEDSPALDRLEKFAESRGVDEEAYEAAMELIDDQETEWEQRA